MPIHKETESLIQALSKIKQIRKVIPQAPEQIRTFDENKLDYLLEVLKSNWIKRVAGYFTNHKSGSPYSVLDDEYKIQDMVYVIATSMIPDLHYENPQPKSLGAITSTRTDFSSQKQRLVIEIKHASSKHKAKRIEAEISEDLVKYGKQSTVDTLIFFIYCHNYQFPNSTDFERSFTGLQTIASNIFYTHCIIKP